MRCCDINTWHYTLLFLKWKTECVKTLSLHIIIYVIFITRHTFCMFQWNKSHVYIATYFIEDFLKIVLKYCLVINTRHKNTHVHTHMLQHTKCIFQLHSLYRFINNPTALRWFLFHTNTHRNTESIFLTTFTSLLYQSQHTKTFFVFSFFTAMHL